MYNDLCNRDEQSQIKYNKKSYDIKGSIMKYIIKKLYYELFLLIWSNLFIVPIFKGQLGIKILDF